MKELGIREIAEMVHGRILGSPDDKVRIRGTCGVDKYQEDKISFVKNEEYGQFLACLKKAVILIAENMVELSKKYSQNIYIVVDNLPKSLMELQSSFYGDELTIEEEGISPTAKIDPSASIRENVYIGENVHIGKDTVINENVKILDNSYIFDNVTIGRGTIIYPDVCIYKNCIVGEDCIIHSGARIGVDGFRFKQDIEEKSVRKMLHVGRVIIGNRVEIGANSAIDRATFEGDATILSDDVKIDNLVHIGHNAKIGARTLIAALSCVGGSDKIGEDVWIGIGVTISNGVSIGNRAKVLLNAVVAYDVAEDEVVSGFYAMPHRQWKQVYKKLKEGQL